MLLDADPFLTQLRKMYAETQGASVFVTMKPCTWHVVASFPAPPYTRGLR